MNPGPDKADWIDFLYWLADTHEARQIVECVESPWKYAPEYAEYVAEGALDR